MAGNGGRTGPAWDRAKALTFARSQTCARCGEPVDMGLSGMHPYGPMCGHIVDVYDGGSNHPDNLQTEHRRCGIIAGNERRNERRRGQTRHDDPLNRGDEWT